MKHGGLVTCKRLLAFNWPLKSVKGVDVVTFGGKEFDIQSPLS